jgi:pimeloyl-ACP methyl ester carboxylesterase
MPQARVNGVKIEYDTFGRGADRPLLLVMGLGAQMIQWDEAFCRQLVDAGHFVIRFDNRDVGLSEYFDSAGIPDTAETMRKMLSGEKPDVPYTADDMAADAFGVLDALDLASAHICGASMGGMIVQTMAINAPRRVRSLTSIMATTGNRALPPAKPEAIAALMSPPARTRDEAIERSLATARVIGSPGYSATEEEIRARAARAFDRAFHPEGVARQMAAIASHGSRKEKLQKLELPALVIHGRDDPLVPVEGGIDTHEALNGSELLVIDGMGHDLPRALWPQIVGAIAELTERAEAQRR